MLGHLSCHAADPKLHLDVLDVAFRNLPVRNRETSLAVAQILFRVQVGAPYSVILSASVKVCYFACFTHKGKCECGARATSEQ